MRITNGVELREAGQREIGGEGRAQCASVSGLGKAWTAVTYEMSAAHETKLLVNGDPLRLVGEPQAIDADGVRLCVREIEIAVRRASGIVSGRSSRLSNRAATERGCENRN